MKGKHSGEQVTFVAGGTIRMIMRGLKLAACSVNLSASWLRVPKGGLSPITSCRVSRGSSPAYTLTKFLQANLFWKRWHQEMRCALFYWKKRLFIGGHPLLRGLMVRHHHMVVKVAKEEPCCLEMEGRAMAKPTVLVVNSKCE